MANKETRIYKTDTLEGLRQKSNEISLHLGDNEQLNALMADKTYNYSAGAGQTLFAGPDTSSPAKTSRFETSPANTVDNTGGYIILEGVSSLASSYVANAVIYQGTSGSETWQGYIVSASTDKILVRDSSGTFATTSDLKVGTDVIVNAKVIRIVTESYPTGIVRVYKNGTELTQDMNPGGFHVANIKATITQTGSPTLTNYTEGVTIYQGDSQSTQADVESNATWYGTLHSVSGGVIRVKTYNGSFSASTLIRALGSSNNITGTQHGALSVVDSTYGSYIELNTPAAAGNAIKVFSLDVVAAINELQDDIGTVESLTTAANDLVLAINEHDAELGTITAGAMGTTASTVSTAIREHEDQIGNIDITDIASGEDTITGALEQLHDEVGDVTASNMGTSASNLTAAVREHEDQIGNENITSIDSGSDTITGALNQLHTEVGDLALHTTSTDLTEAINELEEDLFNGEGGTKRTRASLLTTDKTSIVDSINELHSELFVDGTGVSFTGLSADFFKEAVEELRTELGNHAVLDTNVTTDAVSAINELENVLRDDTTQRTGYVMGTDANNIIAAINEIETVLRGTNTNYTINTAAQNVRDALNEHEQQIGNMLFGTGGPVDAADSDNLSAAVRVLDAEIGDTTYTGADLTTAIRNTQDDILVAGSLTTLNTSHKFIQGAINEIEADLFNAEGVDKRTLVDLKTADKTSILDSINEIYDDIHTAGSVTLDTNANYLVGAINEIEGVFDASTYEISAGTNAFNVTSGTFTIDSSGDIVLDAAADDIILKEAGDEFGRFTSTAGHQLVLKSGANQTFLTASNTNATFNNNLTVENNLDVDGTLNADGATTLNGTTIDGNLDLNGSVDISVNAVIHGTTELNNTLGVDGNFRVGAGQGNKFNVTAASGNTQIDGTLEVDGTAGVDGNFRVGANKFNVVAASGNTQIDGTLEVDGTTGIDGNFRVGAAGVSKFDVVAATGNTQIDGTLDVDGNFEVGATKFNVTASNGNFVAKGTGRVDGHTDLNSSLTVDGHGEFNSTVNVDGVTTISNATASSSSTTGALVVTGGVGIGEDLYVAGDLYVEGDSVTLNTETLTVEDTLVLAGNGLASEPSTGGFGFEVGPITSPSGVASNVTGAHSIVYNYANDRWEADGSLILSSATLDTPYIEGVAFGPSDDLTFSAGSGLSETVVKTGADIVTTYTNTDKGSSQSIFKTVTINGTAGNNVVADSNSDTLNLRGLDAITLTSVPGTDTISIDHDDFGTAGTYGVTGTQDGQYIKSIITNAQGHVTGVTSADFDTRYQATNPSFEIKVNDVKVDDVFPGDKIDLIEGVGIDIAGSLVGTESNITISHQDTSSVGNLSQNNSGNTFIQDLAFTFDTFGHVTGATASTATVAIGNGTFTVSGSSGLAGSGSMTANQSGNSSAGLTNTDKGSDQNIFKNIVVRNLADTTLGTVVADNNNDTIYLDAGNSGITLSVDAGSDHISINHADTSAASSVNNSGRTYIQDITLDTYGHITAISSATESYVYTPPTYAGDDINIDTGALTGATVISDLDFNITTNTLGHVTDANATVATRNLTLANLGYNGWDLYTEGTKRADINVNGIVNFADDAFLTTTYSSTNNTVSYGHPTSPLNGTYGGNNNGIVIEDITVDTRGHITSIGTRDLDGRFDNYGSWNIGDGSTTSAVTAGNTVHIIGGSNISTTRSGDNVTVAFVDPGYLTSQRNATLDVQGNSTNPYIRLTDASADHVQVVGSGTVTVTGSESLDRITIHGTDTNTDINVNDANLRARLAGLNPAQGVAYIGDSGNDLDLRIRGNLTVEGTQTIMNTETVTTHDNAILLNSNATATPTEDGGVELERGNLNNARVFWNEASDRWQHGIVGTMHNIPLPSEADITRFYASSDSGTATITRDNTLGHIGGTAINTSVSGDNITFTHSNVASTTPTSGNTTLANGGQFSVVSGVAVNAQGHVTQVTTKPFTLPTFPAGANNGLLDINAGSLIDLTITGGDFSADKSTETDIIINVDLSELEDMTPSVVGTQDEMVLLDNGLQRRKLISEITLSDFNNDLGNYGGWSTTTGTVTSVATGIGLSGGTITTSGTINLDVAVSNQLGGVKIGFPESGKNYPVELNGSQQAYVNVPWTNTTYSVQDGQLSQNNFTNALKTRLNGIAAGADVQTLTLKAPTYTDSGYNLSVGSTVIFTGTGATTTSRSNGIITIHSTDTNNDTTYSQSIVQNGANVRHLLTAGGSGSGSDEIQFVAGNLITLTQSSDNLTIATTAEVNQNAFSGVNVGTIGGGGTTLSAASKSDIVYLAFDPNSFDISTNTTTPSASITLDTDQRNTIRKIGTIGTGNMTIDTSATGNTYFVTHSGTSDTTGTHKVRFTGGGQIDAAGDIVAYATLGSSDRKLKENIQKVEGALELVSQLDGVTFDWKDKERGSSAGVIAQNVEEVLPSAVRDVDTIGEEGQTHKAVDYNQLSALFIEAIKELKEENKSLRAEIESLKDINS
jgi:hypothetical protein